MKTVLLASFAFAWKERPMRTGVLGRCGQPLERSRPAKVGRPPGLSPGRCALLATFRRARALTGAAPERLFPDAVPAFAAAAGHQGNGRGPPQPPILMLNWGCQNPALPALATKVDPFLDG